MRPRVSSTRATAKPSAVGATRPPADEPRAPPREFYVSAPRVSSVGAGMIARPPDDAGCPCGGGGVCAPQRGLTHAEYSQIIRARVAVHRAKADAAVPQRMIPADAAAATARRRLGPKATVGRPARDSFLRIVDAPIASAFDTAEWTPRGSRVRAVRRYAVWYTDGGVFTDDRVIAAVPHLSNKWRAAARADAAAVVARLALLGHRPLRECAITVDRRGHPDSDRVARADALCAYEKDGARRMALGADCVRLTDDDGTTRAGMIYLPIDE